MKNIITTPVTDKEAWLQQRTQDVTSTEVSALYDLSPYLSEFELFHQKRNQEIVRIEENERMTWGKRLEDAIALGAAETMGWEVEKMNVYMRDVDARMGSSFDYKITKAPERSGVGILEIKNVDGIQYSRNWIDDGEGNIEAPEHIEMQIQHQMEVADIDWCCLVALVGGNTQKIIYRERNREIGADIRAKVATFWAMVDADLPPLPDYVNDAEYIIKKMRGTAVEGLVAEADASLEDLITQYAFTSREVADLTKIKDGYKAQILERVGEASKVLSQQGTISCGMTKPSEGTLVTADMVGTYIGGRKGFRNFRFTAKKGT
jgi:putative phage-type endonuclease